MRERACLFYLFVPMRELPFCLAMCPLSFCPYSLEVGREFLFFLELSTWLNHHTVVFSPSTTPCVCTALSRTVSRVLQVDFVVSEGSLPQ